MIHFLKKYKAFGIGFLIVFAVILLLSYLNVLLLPDDAPIEIFVVFTFWWFIVSLVIHRLAYLKKIKITIYKIIGLFILIAITMFIDSYMNMPDNPISMILLLLFWIGFVHLLLPSFISKYWKIIVLYFSPIILYFIYIRLFSVDLEAYLKIKDNMHLLVLAVPVPIFLGLCLWFFEQWKWLQNLKAEKSEAELALLRTQINPHFFFNTLNNLYALTVKNSKQAPEVILKLSDMMRYTIYEGEKESVALKDEIAYLKNYIELHKIRYRKTVDFQFHQNIEDSLQVAPLLFIILLENAFKHGVETLTEDAYIHIDIMEEEGNIIFTIENNFDYKEVSENKGIGLTNLKRRLALIYPNKHELIMDQQDMIYKTTLKIAAHV